uniref:FAS1 domain-containing protein n=1 Tax=Aegilops tauschii subsp. strangulata TaxID=200361 RepID=A0A453L3N6_AEGTS
MLIIQIKPPQRDLDQGRREGKQAVVTMEFKAAAFTAAVLAVLLCSPASAQKSPPAPSPVSVSIPPSLAPAPAPAPRYVDLAALLDVAGPFHTFLGYLQKTKVIETFQAQANKTDEGITIFVPKDSAFAALKKSTFSNLTGDQLKTLLLYHAFPKYYPLAQFRNLSSLNPVNTFAGSPYTLNLTDDMGSISVESMWSKPKISSSVYATKPIAVYSINNVLLPMQLFSKDPPLAPAPAPAPESGASDIAPSPGGGKAGAGNGKADSTSAGHVGVANCLGLLAAAAGGLMLLW